MKLNLLIGLAFFDSKKKQMNFIKPLACIVFFVSYFTSLSFADEILRLTVNGQSSGKIDILLKSDSAPEHVERIKLLAKDKKYDGVVFHRVIEGFMAQTGDVQFGNINDFDPELVGMGGSDYPMLKQEFSDGLFLGGTVGMARSRDIDSANSQFFIMFEAAPHLDGKYTIVGNVINGMDIVRKIKKGSLSNNGAVESPDYILTAEIIQNQ